MHRPNLLGNGIKMPGPWSDQLRVSLAPGEVAFVRIAKGMRAPPAARGVLHLPPQGADAGWEPTLRELRSRIRELGSGPAEVTVVLSNCFVSYALVPWSSEARDAGAWEDHVRQRFIETHGEPAGGWCLRATRPRPGRTTLACGIDHRLLRELRALLAASTLQLVSVQPLLIAAFNEYRGTMGGAGCLLCYERGALCCVSFAAGEWRRLTMERLPPDAAAASQVGHHLAGCHAGDARTAFLCASAEDAEACSTLSGRHRLQLLPPPQRAGVPLGAALLGRY